MSPRLASDEVALINSKMRGTPSSARAGIAPRLAQHLHNSSLDLTCPPPGVDSSSIRAMVESRQNPV